MKGEAFMDIVALSIATFMFGILAYGSIVRAMARLNRFHHCLFRILSKDKHQMSTMSKYKGMFIYETLSIECTCGKIFWEKNDI